jgi:hypothetical protein
VFEISSDQDVQIGDNWHKRIQTQLNGAKAVVLLISAAFLNSSYITKNELPLILKHVADQSIQVFPILISPCVYKWVKYKYPDPNKGPLEFTLASLQTANPSEKTLIEMNEDEQNRVLEKVADQLAILLAKSSTPGEEITQIPLVAFC